MTAPENGIYVLQGIVPAQIAAAPVPVKVIDLYDDNSQLFTKDQVSQMEAGNAQLLGYFSIGEAENYRSYFASLPASTLGPVDPSWPGDYQVAYWTPAWWTVSTNYIDQMIAQGYDGAFLDVVDECETNWAQKNAPGGDPKGAMVTLIENLAAYAHAKNPNFQIWINSSGAEDLLSNGDFVSAINGVYEEQLFYKNATTKQSAADVNYNLNLLDNVVAAGKPVVAVEYVSGSAQVADVEAKAAAAGIGYYIANPNLELDGVDTQGFASSSGSGGGGSGGGGSGGGDGSGGTPTPPPIAASITGIQTMPSWGDLGKGDVADIVVTLSGNVTVTGTPTLSLNDGGTAAYVSGSGTDTLTFEYTVAAGQNTNHLRITGAALPAGASVVDAAGNAVSFNKLPSASGRLLVDTSRTRTSIPEGTGQTMNAGTGNDIVTLSAGNASLIFNGRHDVAFLGGGQGSVDATIIDHSHGLNVYVLNGGTDIIRGLAADPTAVIDLLGGVGGYTSRSAILSAIQSDGAGGALLPLGAGGSIDFPDIAPASLHPANFRVD